MVYTRIKYAGIVAEIGRRYATHRHVVVIVVTVVVKLPVERTTRIVTAILW